MLLFNYYLINLRRHFSCSGTVVGYTSVTSVTLYPFRKANIYKSEGEKSCQTIFFHPNADRSDWPDLTIIRTNKAITNKGKTVAKIAVGDI